MRFLYVRAIAGVFLFLVLLSALAPEGTSAETIDEIKARIEEQNDQIKKIEEEIATYQKELNVLGQEKQSLQSSIKTLDVSRNQTASQISGTQKKIDTANLRLEELGLEIRSKENLIAIDRATIAESLRRLEALDDVSVIEHILSSGSVSDAWEAADATSRVSDALRAHARALSSAKLELAGQQQQVSSTREDLSDLKTDLSNQKKALDVNRQSKQSLLSQTQSKEANYQALIEKKRAEQKAFELELRALEDALQVVIDPSRIPSPGSGVLAWPFSTAYMSACATKESALKNVYCITQYFGNTSFSTANPQIYNGMGHNGIDFSAPSGTPVASALSGTVLDTGNTDLAPGCYSFGKWVVVKHANGLSTLYAHLSSIQASPGQSISTGDVIGYSGMTGYATGPHLHFAVYASEGLQISTLAQFRSATTPCANVKIPVAPREAYLNPMSYL